MASIKEFREFFLRNTQVNSGAKADQESGYITSYFVNGVSKFNRFLKGNFPSQDIMKKFLESLTFKLNKEDRSKLTEQGLTVIASDTNSESRTSNLTDGSDFTATVIPHQLPEITLTTDGNDAVIGTPNEDGGLKLSILRRTLSGLFRKNYKLEVNVDKSLEIDTTTKKVQLVNDNVTPGNNQYYGTNKTGTKGFYSRNVANLRDSTDYNTPFPLIVGTQNVTGAVAITPSDGEYLIIYEAEITFDGIGIQSLIYRLHKTGAIAINDDRVILRVNPSDDIQISQKIYCTAIATLVSGNQVLLNVTSDKITNITGRSITMIKLNN